jgi:hypothetical protein
MVFAKHSALISLAAAFCLASCRATPHSKLRAAAEALSKTADQCLYDVRDRNESYEASRNCSGLSALVTSYIEAGGFQHEPPEVALIAERARVSAWMARTASLPGGKGVSIW